MFKVLALCVIGFICSVNSKAPPKAPSRANSNLECSRQGYYRHPEDCSRFYRCVKFNQYEDDYTIFEYGCPDGLVFDDRWEVCVWPAQATPCDGS